LSLDSFVEERPGYADMNTGSYKRSGFSLVEVNLAILLVALGMMAIFGLFPSGLKQADTAMSDTHAAMFADFVLNGVRANAGTITNWSDWVSLATFRSRIAPSGPSGDPRVIKDQAGTPITAQTAPAAAVQGPASYCGPVKYILEVGEVDPKRPQLRYVALWVWSGEYVVSQVSLFKPIAFLYRTELCFRGAMP